jgi:hypothetical protein
MVDSSSIMEWKPIDTAPFDRDLELAVIDSRGTRLVAFACRRLTDNSWLDNSWLDVETNKRVCLHTPHALARLVA